MNILAEKIRNIIKSLGNDPLPEVKERLKSILRIIDLDGEVERIRDATEEAIEICVDDLLFHNRENDDLSTEDLKIALQTQSITETDIVRLFSTFLNEKIQRWFDELSEPKH
jgi:hypothetical protein